MIGKITAIASPHGAEVHTGRQAGAYAWPWRPTRAGVVYLGVFLFVLLATFNSANNLLYIAAGIMAGAFVVSFVLPGVCLRKLDVRRQATGHIIAGEPVDLEYQITNRKRIWTCMAIRLEEVHPDLVEAPRGFILHIPRGKSVSLSMRMVARRRGVLALGEIWASCSFPFGFIQRTMRLRVPQEFVVYPRIGLLNRKLAMRYRECIESGTMTSSVRGGNDEFYGIREYRAGDNVRAIHWRSTARMRRLMIRELAANAPPQMIVVLNLRGAETGDGPGVERAIELAAALLCYGFIENFSVGLAIAGLDTENPPTPQTGRDARAQMLRRLAVLDLTTVRGDIGISFPNRLAGRAEWIIVTLHGKDECRDLTPPGSRSGGTSEGPTVLALDALESENWVRYLEGGDMRKMLRES